METLYKTEQGKKLEYDPMEVDEHAPPSKRTKLDSQVEDELYSVIEINKLSFQNSVISITQFASLSN